MNTNIIRQIPIADGTTEQYRDLIALMKQKGYEISPGLRDISDDRQITAVVIDNADRKVFKIGITALSGWCNRVRRPLNPDEFIKYQDRLIKDPDEVFYWQLISQPTESGIYIY